MELRTLGELALCGSDFTRPKPLLLLTYLAVEGPQERRFLAELFWPRARDHMKSLTVALTLLRRGASGAVEADHLRAWTEIQADMTSVLSALESGALERGIELYRGPFLAGLHLPSWGTELEEWVYKTREYVAGRVQGAMLELAEGEAAQDRFAAATRHAETAYKLTGTPPLEPDDLEHIYIILRAGNSPYAAEARKEAEAYGLTLALSSKAAEASLQQRRPIADHPAFDRLPVRGTTFVGRDLELTEVAGLLSQPECRLLTLVGPAGAGKTRLGLQVAQEQHNLETFKDGICFVPLDALTSANFIPTALADALGLDLRGQAEPLAQVIRHLRDREILLVMDNFEHLVEGAAMISELARNCPKLKLLLTSRERLNLEEEAVFPVTGLPFPSDETMPPDEGLHFDAVRLFTERAERVRPQLTLTKDDLPHVFRICRLVDGLPLGLELAAVWIKVLPCNDIADEIEKNLDFLKTSTRNIADRHRSIRAAFEHSWKLLTQSEQEVLRKLSVFLGGFRREEAAEVAGATIPVLASLVDKSLLRVTPTGRYDRHPLLYRYTQDKLAEHPVEASQSHDRHGSCYLHFLGRREGLIGGPAQKELWRVMDEEGENIAAACRWAVAQQRIGELARCAEAFWLHYEVRGRFQEGEAFFAEVAEGLREDEPSHHPALGWMLVGQGWHAYRLGRYDEASQLARRGVALLRPVAREPWLVKGMLAGLRTLGDTYIYEGKYRQAKVHLEEALELSGTLDYPAATGTILHTLAEAEMWLGDYALADEHLQKSLALCQTMGQNTVLVRTLGNLGALKLVSGKFQDAVTFCREGLEVAENIGFLTMLPHLLAYQALASAARGEALEAQRLSQQAMGLAAEADDPLGRVWAMSALGHSEVALGYERQARLHLEQSLALAFSQRIWPAVPFILLRFAELWMRRGKLTQAAGLLCFVRGARAARRWDKNQAQERLNELRGRLPRKSLDEALERGKAMTLTAAVEEALRQGGVRS